MRGINDTNKREEGLDIFKKRKFDLLALTDTKLKGRGEVSWCEVNGIISGVREMERGREGVAVLLNDVCADVLALESSGLSSSPQGLKFVMVVGYGPNEAEVEEIDRLWIL